MPAEAAKMCTPAHLAIAESKIADRLLLGTVRRTVFCATALVAGVAALLLLSILAATGARFWPPASVLRELGLERAAKPSSRAVCVDLLEAGHVEAEGPDTTLA